MHHHDEKLKDGLGAYGKTFRIFVRGEAERREREREDRMPTRHLPWCVGCLLLRTPSHSAPHFDARLLRSPSLRHSRAVTRKPTFYFCRQMGTHTHAPASFPFLRSPRSVL